MQDYFKMNIHSLWNTLFISHQNMQVYVLLQWYTITLSIFKLIACLANLVLLPQWTSKTAFQPCAAV